MALASCTAKCICAHCRGFPRKLTCESRLQFEIVMERFLVQVRFLPETISLAWRYSNSNSAPSDLQGHVPPKPFALLDNSVDAPVLDPPHFAFHPLRSDQLRSLSWMLSREGIGAAPASSIFEVDWRRYWTSWIAPDVQIKKETLEVRSCIGNI